MLKQTNYQELKNNKSSTVQLNMPPKSAAPISILSLLDSGDKETKPKTKEIVILDDTEDEDDVDQDGDSELSTEKPVMISREEFKKDLPENRKSAKAAAVDIKPEPMAKQRKPRAVTKKKEQEKIAEQKAKAEAKAEAKAKRDAARANRVAKAKNKTVKESAETQAEKSNGKSTDKPHDKSKDKSKDKSNDKSNDDDEIKVELVTQTPTAKEHIKPLPIAPSEPIKLDPKVPAASSTPSTPTIVQDQAPKPTVAAKPHTPSSIRPNILNLMNPQEDNPIPTPQLSTFSCPPPSTNFTSQLHPIALNELTHPRPVLASVPPLVSPHHDNSIKNLVQFSAPAILASQAAEPSSPAGTAGGKKEIKPKALKQPKKPTEPKKPAEPKKATESKKSADSKKSESKDTKKSTDVKDSKKPTDSKDTKKELKPKKENKKSNSKKDDDKKESTPTPTLTPDQVQNKALKQPSTNSDLGSPSFIDIPKVSNITTESPKEPSTEVITEPIIALNIPLLTKDSERGTAQVVFNVLKMTEDKYGWKNVHPNASKFAMDLMNDDDMEEDDDADGAGPPEEEEEEKEPPVKIDGRTLQKGKPKIGQYDTNDPFIDDTEMLYEEQRASTKDGFFVYYGPLVEEGKNARIERADGTIKRNRKRVAGTTNLSTQPKKKPNIAPKQHSVPPTSIAPSSQSKLVPIAIAPSAK